MGSNHRSWDIKKKNLCQRSDVHYFMVETHQSPLSTIIHCRQQSAITTKQKWQHQNTATAIFPFITMITTLPVYTSMLTTWPSHVVAPPDIPTEAGRPKM
jgi:hypothetical protein